LSTVVYIPPKVMQTTTVDRKLEAVGLKFT